MKKELQSVLLTGLDARVPVLRQAQASALRPARGWLRAVRSALGLSQEFVAKKTSMTRQAFADMEAAEQRGAISLNSLQRAAEAMDCELVYFIAPREEVARTFGELARIHDPDLKHLQASEHSMALEDQAVGDLRARRKP
ncbi:MAG TPA: helix-turn-helix domain-containing protein [Opitutaceae bacterium]|nr:helix-turn-helix domain-containing protein [Opitutaceae bacterium]